MPSLSKLHAASGNAALAICESLLLALTDLKVMSDQDARDLLTDAATAHREAGIDSHSPEMHEAVVAIIERILDGKDSVPHQ
jgi:hypothetical protein